MRLSLESFEAAVGEMLSPKLGGMMRQALTTVRGGDPGEPALTPDEAGSALLVAILGNLPDALGLREVDLDTQGGHAATLPPTYAVTHPLLERWTPLTLPGAIGQVILAGAALTAIGNDGPVFGSIQFWRTHDGQITATAALRFAARAEVTATLHYGVSVPVPGFMTIHQLHADHLFAVGRRSTENPDFSHALAQDAAIAAADAAALGGSIH